MNRAPATAKLNLTLVVGPLRDDGRHEVVTVLQRIDLADRVSVEPAAALRVDGFPDDTLVRSSLERLAETAGAEPRWRAQIWKNVPVAAGLGGGSSDAATALRLANETLPEPLSLERLHEVVTVLQRIDLADRVSVEPAAALRVDGFPDDTLVRSSLERLAETAGAGPRWRAQIWKNVPVAAGLGGGSSDAATALRLANETLPEPLSLERLHELAAELGADVPFFLTSGPQLGKGTGAQLEPLDLPQDYWVVLVLPRDQHKPSTASVYAEFDRREGAEGFDERRARLLEALGDAKRPGDLAALPPNDLASSPHAQRLLELGAFRADVSGAGPAVYGLFLHRAQATAAEREMRALGRTWITVPTWYG